jgi:branched-chain amino acid transport system substrate-binding protein
VTLVQVIKQCGNDLSRENIMRQAANLKDFQEPFLYPGILVNTSPTNYSPIHQMQLTMFTGAHWEPIGDVMSD